MKRISRIMGWGLAVVALAMALRIAWFIISVQYLPAYDDECKIAIQAEDIAHGRDFPLLILASPYVFPLDAYLMALTTRFLPHGEIGIRTIALLQGLGSLLVCLFILRTGGRWREVWPGVMLVLFPSAYLLMMQSATLLPGYPPMFLMGSLSIWLALRRPDRVKGVALSTAGAGVASGLACSGSMLSISFLACSAAASLLQRRWLHALVAALCFAGGAWLGLMPHRAAEQAFGGAFESVQRSVGVNDALHHLGGPLMQAAWPSALGLGAPFFPDTAQRVPGYEGIRTALGYVWLPFLALASLWALWRFVRDWIRMRHPVVTFDQVFLALSWACFVLFIFSVRSHSRTFRYALPAVMAWPMILAGLYAYSGRPVKIAVAAISLLFLGVNVHNTHALLTQWRRPDFADELSIFDQKPAIAFLTQRGIHHAYATYADAYRLTYASRGDILCGQPFNERFPEWPTPYADELAASTNVAYVLAPEHYFTSTDFERHCVELGVTFRRTDCGRYQVYTDFNNPAADRERKLDSHRLSATASYDPDKAERVLDGDPLTRYRTSRAQSTDMWFQVSFPERAWISRVVLDNTMWKHDRAEALNVEARLDSGEWKIMLANVPRKRDHFAWMNQHPVYTPLVQSYHFQPVFADAVRVSIAKPAPHREWRIGEIEVFGPIPFTRDPPGPPVAAVEVK